MTGRETVISGVWGSTGSGSVVLLVDSGGVNASVGEVVLSSAGFKGRSHAANESSMENIRKKAMYGFMKWWPPDC